MQTLKEATDALRVIARGGLYTGTRIYKIDTRKYSVGKKEKYILLIDGFTEKGLRGLV